MEVLTGDWENFTFKLIEPEDYEKILEHIHQNFYRTELLCQLTGYSKEITASFDRSILDILPYNMSFCAVHKESQKIAGVRIMFESTKNEYSSNPSPCCTRNVCWKGDNVKHHFLTELEDKCNIFQIYGEDGRYAQLHLTSVSPEYPELVNQIYSRGNEFLAKLGFTMAKGCFSDQHYGIATKFGFKELARLYPKDFKNKEGIHLFPTAGVEQFVALMAVKLK